MANFINAIKSVIVNKVDEIKNVVRQQKNVIEAAVTATNLDLTPEMVAQVAMDEATKYSSYDFEFRIVYSYNDEFEERMRKWEEFGEYNINKRLGILTHFDKVRTFTKEVARQAAFKSAFSLAGETLTVEHDGKDAVYIYPEVLCQLWFNLSKEGESWDECVRQIVRHEFRHALQFKKVRERGYNGCVLLVYETDIGWNNYHNRITERDAWGNQTREPKDQDPIEPVIDALFAKFRHA